MRYVKTWTILLVNVLRSFSSELVWNDQTIINIVSVLNQNEVLVNSSPSSRKRFPQESRWRKGWISHKFWWSVDNITINPSLREAIITQIKDFFVKSLQKLETIFLGIRKIRGKTEHSLPRFYISRRFSNFRTNSLM